MNEFMQGLSQLISKIQNYQVVDDVLSKKIASTYANLSQKEQTEMIQMIDEALKDEIESYICVFKELYRCTGEQIFFENVYTALLSSKIDYVDKMVLKQEMMYYLFSNGSTMEYVTQYKMLKNILMNITSDVENSVKLNLSYIPYGKRQKKRIVLMIEPILRPSHAPTSILINLCYYYEKLGYEVRIIASNTNKLTVAKRFQYYISEFMNCLSEDTGMFDLEMLGQRLRGYHIMYEPEKICQQIFSVMQKIREYNPEFVLSIGGGNVLAEICSKMTTVAVVGTTNHMPLTDASYIYRYFNVTSEQEQEYQECQSGNQKIMQVELYPTKSNFKSEVPVTKTEYNIPEDIFLIQIVGNRLDTEVSDEFIGLLADIVKDSRNVMFGVVGDCKILKKKMIKQRLENYCIFFGYISNFQNVIGIGDLFLNPPRQGGGAGGQCAIWENVPVVTMPNCDVASAVNDKFLCDSLEDMRMVVKRYVDDPVFYKQQVEECKKINSQSQSEDSCLKSIKSFNEKIVSSVIKEEKMDD